MILLVDTYNVLHVVGVLPPELAGIDARELAGLISTGRYSANRVELICDGVSAIHPAPRVGLVRIRYAGAERLADDLIAALIRESSSPRKLTVVSSDTWVIKQARRRRCKTLSSEQFLNQIVLDSTRSSDSTAPRRPTEPLGPGEVEQWMDIFDIQGGEERRIQLRASDLPQSPSPAPGPGIAPGNASGNAPGDAAAKPAPRKKRQSPPQSPPAERRAHSDDPLPQDLIEQAERIWAEREKL